MNAKRLFSLTPKDPYQNFTKGNKIELLVCKTGSQNCKEHLSIINKCYIEATEYHLEKDYLNSIESLKSAFFNTTGLKEDSCIKCADLFRSTITKSIENINDELYKMTTGVIANNAYLKSYYASCDVLNDLKKEI